MLLQAPFAVHVAHLGSVCGPVFKNGQTLSARLYHHFALFSIEEREKFSTLLDSGFIDTYRYFNKDKTDAYTWWSYMGNAREKNIGWRLDYFLISKSFINSVKSVNIHEDVFGSDHCPISIEVDFE